MALTDELESLSKLYEQGMLTPEEYQQAKAKLLREHSSTGANGDSGPPPAAQDGPFAGFGRGDLSPRQWAALLHWSMLAGIVLPLAGLVAPIIIWQIKRERLPGLDTHAYVVLNWILSLLIYSAGLGLIALTMVGIPIALIGGLALTVLAIVFPIIGGIRANEGTVWPYPLSIPFFQHADRT